MEILKKLVIILVMSAYLLTTTELIQFFKVPALIGHYVEHHSTNNSLTFWQYLSMHYAEEHANEKDGDQSKDKQLPFKTSSCNAHSLIIFTVHNLILIKPQINSADNHKSILSCSISLGVKSTIWQPPKFS